VGSAVTLERKVVILGAVNMNIVCRVRTKTNDYTSLNHFFMYYEINDITIYYHNEKKT
jgi:hypothetical protein